ncbi:YciK family oxidoreductase [Dongshaea marina]|uniref:YciK family oxidoreductase n=1 Tax=Dongshaea marina TaxID=2047966 RepID=UPI001F2EDDF9|nr:YciK family oxidoreductase [Dongshaea marina]
MHDYQIPPKLLANRYIGITGPTEGIGRQLAFSVREADGIPVLLGRSAAKLEALAQELSQAYGLEVIYELIDFSLATPEICQQLAERLMHRIPRLDGLLHNAGVLGELILLEDTSEQQWDLLMQVNLKSQFLLTQALLPLMRKANSASLIFTSSGVGQQGRALWGTYAISKFATEGMMQTWAEELASESIRVNCINPGATRTGMRASAKPDEDPQTLRTPLDIMPTYLYLLGLIVSG